MDTEVLIAGAGPVGLMLAIELRLGGVDVLVCEQREAPSGESRGLGFTARAAEVLDQRGLLERLGPTQAAREGHFGGIPLDFGVLPGAHSGIRGVPQDRIETMLTGRALELGARIRRGHTITGLPVPGADRPLAAGESEPDHVEVEVTGPDGCHRVRAGWLVGCDGGRSPVRGLAGFEFPGVDATRLMYLADVVGRDIRPRFIGERVAGGMVMSAPLRPGLDRIIVCERGTPLGARDRPVEFTEVADAWERLTGESLHGAATRWVSTFTDATRQAATYRRGRVLLAGDAAHVHLPAGGQGLSVGVQDAANLGWKLAATVRGWAPPGLLDTYHAERHPVGERLLRNTRAQGVLYLGSAGIEPLRGVVGGLMTLPAVGRLLAGMVSGLDIRYPMSSGTDGSGTAAPGRTPPRREPAHPLLGARLPDAPLYPDGGGPAGRVFDLLRPARGVLLAGPGATGDGPAALAGPWPGRVEVVRVRRVPAEPGPVGAVLLRPDGHVAWVGHPGATTGLGEACRRWFGAPAPAVPTARQPDRDRQPAGA